MCLLAALGSCTPGGGAGAEFEMRLPDLERVWIGPDYYGNRLQDWRLANDRVEAITGDSTRSMRTLQLLTYSLSEEPGRLEMSVRTGPVEAGGRRHENTWTGFLIGAGGDDVDYRISALVHDWPAPDGGLIVALDGTGKVVVRDNTTLDSPKTVRANVSTSVDAWPLIEPATVDLAEGGFEDVVFTLVAEPMPAGDVGADRYRLTVSVTDGETGAVLGGATYEDVAAEFLSGSVGLVSHNSRHTAPNPALQGREPRAFETELITSGPGYWFRDWQVSGSKVAHHPERAFGPVMGAMHTLSDGTLKMTAQMGPIGADDTRTGELQVQRDGRWQTVATGEVIDVSYTMPLRVEGWDAVADTPYRIVYDLRIGGFNADMTQTYFYEGAIRAEPRRNDFVLASMNCQHFSARPDEDASARGFWNSSGIWFPHSEVARAVEYHNPDMLYFAGDQIYEGGLAGIVREPWDEAALDYLYHWYWFVWSFRDLMRDIPTIATPDDHDVYQGNIWRGRRQAWRSDRRHHRAGLRRLHDGPALGQRGAPHADLASPRPARPDADRAGHHRVVLAGRLRRRQHGGGVRPAVQVGAGGGRSRRAHPQRLDPEPALRPARRRCARRRPAGAAAARLPRRLGAGLGRRRMDEGAAVADALLQPRHHSRRCAQRRGVAGAADPRPR